MGLLILDCESEYHIIVTNVKKTLQGRRKDAAGAASRKERAQGGQKLGRGGVDPMPHSLP